MQTPQSLDFETILTTTYVLMFPEDTMVYEIQEFLTNSQKYLCTFQLFIDATKITKLWSHKYNLRLEGAIYIL